ncbi:MAG: energy-coupling factor transporter transmembrane component T, partial [Candidatus Avispirillum sp.]
MRQTKTKRDEFSFFHPLVSFVYFALVLGFTVVLRHPASQLVSLAAATVYAATAQGAGAVFSTLKISIPVILFTAAINPVFNHQGVTILCYLPWGNPLTLESILYGISAGAVLAASLLWFVNINRVFTSDKFVYLFGRIIPSLSLLLSMTLRFVPLFRKRLILVSESRKCVGRDISKGGIISRMKNAAAVFSITVTWSLEN